MPSGNHWLRLNYGVVGRRHSDNLCCVHAWWVNLFHIKLPLTNGSGVANPLPASLPCSSDVCERTKVVTRSIKDMAISMRIAVERMVEKIYDLIPDAGIVPPGSKRPTRGLFDIVGKASSCLFGTATNADIEGLRKT